MFSKNGVKLSCRINSIFKRGFMYAETAKRSKRSIADILSGFPAPVRLMPEEKNKRNPYYRSSSKKGKMADSLTRAVAIDVLKAYGAGSNENIHLLLAYSQDRVAINSVKGAIDMVHPFAVNNRILAIVPRERVDAALKAGALYAGGEDLISDIESNALDFNQVVGTPNMMPVIKKLARTLGPRKLVPNAKMGTLVEDVEGKIPELLRLVAYQADKKGIVSIPIGPPNFITDNLRQTINTAKKSCVLMGKGTNIFTSIHLSCINGPTIKINDISLN